MDTILTGSRSGRPLKIWVAQGPKHSAITRAVEELGGRVVGNSEIAQYAIVEQRATDLGRVFASLKRSNPDIHILSHQWLYDCKAKQERLSIEGYEITRQPLPPAKKGTRTAFTPEDDMKLAKFIARYSKPKGRLGHSLYEEVEKFLPNHTAQSWRQRYKTNQARLDHEIAKYEAIVQERRDNHEDAYTDSENEGARFTGTSGKGGWPSRSQASQKGQSRVVKPAAARPESSPPAESSQRFKRSAIKTQPPPKAAVANGVSQKRPFRLDFEGPGERITFSDDEELSITHTSVSKRRKQEDMVQETISESVQEELAQRSFPPLARNGKAKQVLPDRDDRASMERSDYRQGSVNLEQETESAPVKYPQVPLAGPSTLRSSVPVRMTSRPLSRVLTQDTWTGTHLNTLLSAPQFNDLVFVCSGDIPVATEIATLLYQNQVEGLDRMSQKRAELLRKVMWSPEEDAILAAGERSSRLILRHGASAVVERCRYLETQYWHMGNVERARRRFPYDEVIPS